tara:strand:+ start:4002 stop:4787 length:786 start_codon:yes stop_codon:yes gene_type:complete
MKNIVKIGSVVAGVALLAACGQKEQKETKSATEVAKKEDSVQLEVKKEEVVKTKVVEAPEEVAAAVLTEIKPSFVIEEGVHYEVLKTPLDIEEYDGITVSEFFWLGCPHCQNFEPMVQSWKTQLNVDGKAKIAKTAVPGNPRWNQDAGVFFVLKELGASDVQISLMLKMYEAERIKNKALPDNTDIASFFEKLGFDKVKAMEILNDSQKLEPLLHKANTEYNKTDSQGVPTFVVNGKYKLKFDKMDSEEMVINTIKQLSEK